MSIPLINWREAPFLRLLLPFVAGILSATWLPYSANAAMAAAVGIVPGLAALLWLSYRRLPYSQRWTFGAVLGLALAGLGYLLGAWSDERRAKDHFSAQLLEQNLISAEVLQIQLRGERLRLQLKLKAIGTTAADIQSARGRLLAHLPVDATTGKIGIGDHLLIRAAIAPIPGPKNPKAFDYRRFLHNKNIHYQCFVGEDDWRLQRRTSERRFDRLTYAARQYCIGVLRQHLPTPNEFGAGSALILGYRDETPGELRDAYAATGATHVLAVSGLHVGIVQMVITFLLQFWGGKGRERRVWKMGITLLGVWGFTMLTGAPSSALRAATMFSFLTVGRALRRPANIYNTIAAAAFFMLCLRPGLLFDVGFQLSYLAVIGIVYFHPKIYALWYIENRIGDYLWQLTALSLAATLTTFPLSLLYFHQFPAYFWLSGLVAVPAAALILGSGLLLLAVHSIPLLGMLVGKLLYGMIWLMNASIFLIQQLPGSRISGIWIGAGTAVLLYAVLAAAALAISSRRFRWVLVALVGGVLIGGVGLWEQWKAHQRQEIVLYHTRRQTVIDFFDGKRVFTLSGTPLTEEDHTFALQNYRWYAQSRPQGAWLLHESPDPAAHWFYRNGLARFYDVRLAVMNRPLPANQSVTTDYLLIKDNPRQSMEELTTGWTISSRTVLFDASNSRRRTSRWMAECESLGLSCYDVEQNGAFVLNLRKSRK